MSRATEQDSRLAAEADEATWNNLYLVAFPDRVDSSHPIRLITLRNGVQNNDGYTDYTVTLYPDLYRFYLLANIDDYLSTDAEGRSTNFQDRGVADENDLRRLLLNFNTDKPIKAGNIPMACPAEEIEAYDNGTKVTGRRQSLSNSYVEIYGNSSNAGSPAKNVTIYADMTYLCSKVRYTILFNRTSGGFSSGFADNDVAFTGDGTFATAENVRLQTALTPDGTANSTIGSYTDVELHAAIYDDALVGSYLNGYSSGNPPASLEALNETPTEDAEKLAWQGIMYLPENLNDAQGNHTAIAFTANGKALSDSYTITFNTLNNDISGNGPRYGLKRGKMYDVVARVTQPQVSAFDINLEVNDWSPKELGYRLHGPYELVVQQTEGVAVESGKWTLLGYNSDVDVEFISPLALNADGSNYVVDGEDVPFYTLEHVDASELLDPDNGYEYEPGWNNYLRITVNGLLPYSYLKDIDTGAGNPHGYFHVKAGSLVKKISVSSLKVDPVLEISPVNISIAMGDYIAAGINSDRLTISYSTNVGPEEAKIKITDTDGIIASDARALYMPIISGLSGSGGEYTLENPQGELTLNLSGMITGDTFWKEDHDLSLTFSLAIGDKELTETVRITVRRFNIDYTVYFKPVNDDWNDAHIYVYSLLELPHGLDADHKKWEGMTVGYKNGAVTAAAPEYVYSNNIAFRGWYGFGGPSVNDPNAGNHSFGEGYVFVGGDGNAYSFAPVAENESRYNFDVDFNELHYGEHDSWNCEKCKGYPDNKNALLKFDNGDDRTFPGIAMTPVVLGNGEKWWKYTLIGLATPGKTLLVFSDGHEAEVSARYPVDDETGLPLFDYPDKTGYLLYDESKGTSNGFVNTKP